MSGTMQAVRQTCIELVEAVDTVILRSSEAKNLDGDNIFDEAVIKVMRKIAAIPAIHRLRGRVREASNTEVIAAMTYMMEITDDSGSEEMIRALIAASIEAGKPQVAQRLRAIHAQMLAERRKASEN